MSFILRIIVEPGVFLYVSDFVNYLSFVNNPDYGLILDSRDVALTICEHLNKKYHEYNIDIVEF